MPANHKEDKRMTGLYKKYQRGKIDENKYKLANIIFVLVLSYNDACYLQEERAMKALYNLVIVDRSYAELTMFSLNSNAFKSKIHFSDVFFSWSISTFYSWLIAIVCASTIGG